MVLKNEYRTIINNLVYPHLRKPSITKYGRENLIFTSSYPFMICIIMDKIK